MWRNETIICNGCDINFIYWQFLTFRKLDKTILMIIQQMDSFIVYLDLTFLLPFRIYLMQFANAV